MSDGSWQDFFREVKCYPPLLNGVAQEKEGAALRIWDEAGFGVNHALHFRRWCERAYVDAYTSLFIPIGAQAAAENEAVRNHSIDEKIMKLNSEAIRFHNNSDETLYSQIRSENWTSVPTARTEEKNFDCIKDSFRSTDFFDPTGATIVHHCFLNQRFATVKWFVQSYPSFSLWPYHAGSPYEGQNLLHLAVLARNHEFAQWLLDFYSKNCDQQLFKLVTARVCTRGNSYFRVKGRHYYGETPLHFAVCMNDTEMVNIVLSAISLLHTDLLHGYPATAGRATPTETEPATPFSWCSKLSFCDGRAGKTTTDNSGYEDISLSRLSRKMDIRASRNLLFMPDCHGNNVIHLCVIHNLPQMYGHIKYLAMELLRQELMRVFHFYVSLLPDSLALKEAERYAPLPINYTSFYSDVGDPPGPTDSFYFKGHIRRLETIQLPDSDAVELIHSLQFWKLLRAPPGAGNHDLEVWRIFWRWFQNHPPKGGCLPSKFLARSIRSVLAVSTSVDGQTIDDIGDIEFERLRGSLRNEEGKGSAPTSRVVSVNAVLRRCTNLTTISEMEAEFKDLVSFDWDSFFKETEARVKGLNTQWLYGTDTGLKNGAVNRMFKENMLLGLNEDGHSPVTLSAAYGRPEMLRALILENVVVRERNYDFDLTSVEFPIETMNGKEESVYCPAVPAVVPLGSAISWICRNEENNKMIDLIPEIKAVMESKWDRVGYPIANRNNMLHLAFLVPIALLACLTTVEHSEFENPASRQPSSYILVWCSFIVLYISYHDWYTYLTTRYPYLSKFCNTRTCSTSADHRMPAGIGFLDWLLRLFIGGTLVAIVIVRFHVITVRSYQQQPDYEKETLYCSLVGACALCSVLYSFMFLMLAEADFGSFLTTITRILVKDFSYFARLFLRVVIMFGLALKTITDDVDDNGFVHAFRCMWALIRVSFQVQTGEYDILSVDNQYETVWFSFLVTTFNLTVYILIINLLIAVMSNTYNAFIGKNALGKLIRYVFDLSDTNVWQQNYFVNGTCGQKIIFS
jgi:hypothetical protein